MNCLRHACLHLGSALIAGLLAIPSGAWAEHDSKKAPAGEIEPRVALVVGNAAYHDSPLTNPVNDARDIAKALREIGFKVTLKTDVSQQAMKQALREFGQELRRGGVGLFYFAGHGVQSRGRNFLIPVGATITAEAELEDQSVDANLVLSHMGEAENRLNIVILDACRNNPFAKSFRSFSRGLAQMDATKGSFVAFATAPGAVASDGSGRNGLYTEHLLHSLSQGDPDIDKVFRRVAANVSTITNGKQVPWVASSLTGDFSFRAVVPKSVLPAPGERPVAATHDSLEMDRAFWDSIKGNNNHDEMRAYLRQFPDGTFAALAHLRISAAKPASPDSAGSKEKIQLAAIAEPAGSRKIEVNFTALEEARATARKNAESSAERLRPLYRDFDIVSRGDSSQSPDCPQGDGWATIDLVSADRKQVVQFKCSTVSPSIGCLEVSDFKTKSYAQQDGTCQPTVRVPYPLPSFGR